MFAIGGKTDINHPSRKSPLIAISGHTNDGKRVPCIVTVVYLSSPHQSLAVVPGNVFLRVTMQKYSRENPSPRFREMEAMYQQMHSEGDAINAIEAERTFAGHSLVPHVQAIGNCIRRLQSKTLLDYGCGKAMAYEHTTGQSPDGQTKKGLKAIWGLDEICLYDPGYAPYQEYPTGQYDAVISTDVLEHITKEDMDWVVAEILGFAQKVVFLNMACYPAKKILPNGENAHITQESPGWWLDLIHGIKRSNFDFLEVLLAIDDKDKNRVVAKL